MSLNEAIKLGKIYKRIEILSSTYIYPEYVVPTSIYDIFDNQYRFRFFDIKRATESQTLMRQSIIEKYYELQE